MACVVCESPQIQESLKLSSLGWGAFSTWGLPWMGQPLEL